MLRKLEPGIEPSRKAAPDPEQAGYRVDDLVIDVRRQRVTRAGEPLGLSPLSFELLLALLRAAPGLVSLDQLMRRVWPDVVVSPETVSQRVKLVRHALGDDAAAPRYIAGVRGRGYRVIAPVSPLEPTEEPATEDPAPSSAVSDGARGAVQETRPVTPAARPGSHGNRRLRRWAVYASGVALALAFIYATSTVSPGRSPGPAARAAATVRAGNSLAVLPFANLSGDAVSRSFGEGLSEEILHRLSRSGGLRVLARTSSFAYRSSRLDARALQELLGVRYLLEGSIRREGRELRITVHLVDQSGFRVWSGSWHRRVGGEFALQDEIAAAVAASVERRVAGALPPGAQRDMATAGQRSGGDRLEPGAGRRGNHAGRHRSAFR